MPRVWRRDAGLTFRMTFTMVLLAAVYLAFVWVLLSSGVSSVFTLVLVAAMLGVQYFYSDKMVLWSTGARLVTPAEQPELHATVGRLAQLADLPKPRVAVVPSPVPNAFATGRDPQHAVVAATEGLLSRLEPEELEAVLAHEITHVRNRDVAVITLASFFATVAAFLLRWLFWFGPMGGRRDNQNGGVNPILVLYLASFAVWIISYFLIRALSRYREFAADRGSAQLTGQPSHLAAALVKISGVMERIPRRDLRQTQGMNAFYIVPQITGASFMELFATHPSLQRRLAYLKKIEAEMQSRT